MVKTLKGGKVKIYDSNEHFWKTAKEESNNMIEKLKKSLMFEEACNVMITEKLKSYAKTDSS